MTELVRFRREGWKPVASHREDRGIVKVVWLQGTPYEMGYQHGKLLHEEIDSLPRSTLDAVSFLGKHLGLASFAKKRCFNDVIEECEGLVAGAKGTGLTMSVALVFAFGDVFQEYFANTLPRIFNDGAGFPQGVFNDVACSQFIASGKATTDGRLYHGRSLDNNGKPNEYWLKNPTVFVRQPNNGIPHMFIAVPGVVWPNSGMNASGITLALDTAHPKNITKLATTGRSHVQMMAQILKQANSYEEARAFMQSQRRMAADLILIADGISRKAGVFELIARSMGIREMGANGVLYMANHFVSPEMQGEDRDPPSRSSLIRHERFKQLLEPGGPHSRHGKINPAVMIQILRDRINPFTLNESPSTIYDDNASIATNGVVRQVVFDSQRLLFWLATGEVPIPKNPFVGFSLGEMLNLPNAVPCQPLVYQ
ncbi:MAG: C45 family peptidase [Oculatellaceae cyanobacterium bins.114]|nr:C45 family peptidase [Oculatellaceae cyanobacterium bins.114]